MRGMRCGFVLSLAACAASAALHAATMEEIEKGMKATEDTYTSLSYTQISEQKEPQFEVRTTATRTVEAMKQGKLWLARSEVESTTQQTIDGKTVTSKRKDLFIREADWEYSLSEIKGVQSAFRTKREKNPIVVNNDLELYKDSFDLKALPDEKIDGHDCFVVEATHKNQPQPEETLTLWFAKSCGVMMKFVCKNRNGRESTLIVTNLKVNPKIDADRFVFRAPEGVVVKDPYDPSESTKDAE